MVEGVAELRQRDLDRLRVLDVEQEVVELRIPRSAVPSTVRPSAVICSRSARRSSSATARVTRPRSASVSIVAETVGLVSARRPAIWLARSAPSAIMANSRYWDRVSSVHARSSRRARRARVRTAASMIGSIPNSSYSYLCQEVVR